MPPIEKARDDDRADPARHRRVARRRGPSPGPARPRGRLVAAGGAWAALATGLFAVGLIAHFAPAPASVAWVFFLASYAAGGWEPGLAGLRALRRKTLDVDLLMVVAAVGAAAVGQVLDGGLLIVIFATSGALEAVATHRTAQAVRGLLDLAPEQAVRITGDDAEETVEAEGLRIGDVILVRPGERIAADGGCSPAPATWTRPRSPASRCRCPRRPGTRCSPEPPTGSARCASALTGSPLTRRGRRIVAMVEEASATKARTQLFIEKIEQRYSSAWSPRPCCCLPCRCSRARRSSQPCCAP